MVVQFVRMTYAGVGVQAGWSRANRCAQNCAHHPSRTSYYPTPTKMKGEFKFAEHKSGAEIRKGGGRSQNLLGLRARAGSTPAPGTILPYSESVSVRSDTPLSRDSNCKCFPLIFLLQGPFIAMASG